MTLEEFRIIADLFVLLVALPVGAWRIWRKLDQRLSQQDVKLNRIEYALFNDGRGMEQQLREVYKNQQNIITDIAILKATK